MPTFIEVTRQSGQYVREIKSPVPRVYFRTLDGGVADLVFRGAEAPEKLRGPNKAGLWFDEASIIPKAAFEIAIAVCRFRGKMGPVSCTFTPRGFKHWTFEQFFKAISEKQAEDHESKGVPVRWFAGKPFSQRKDTHLVKCATWENPFAPREYTERIGAQYSEMMRAQELAGDYLEISGLMFRREWFQTVSEAPRDAERIRYWDKASSPNSGAYTAGVLLARDRRGVFFVEDVRRGQWGPHERDTMIEQTAREDAYKYRGEVTIWVESEGGFGREVTDNIVRKLAEFPVYRDPVSAQGTRIKGGVVLPGDAKIRRAMPFSAQAENGNVRIVSGEWNGDFLDELAMFPEYSYADQCDAASAAYLKLAKLPIGDVSAAKQTIGVNGSLFGLTATVGGDSGQRYAALPWNQNLQNETGDEEPWAPTRIKY